MQIMQLKYMSNPRMALVISSAAATTLLRSLLSQQQDSKFLLIRYKSGRGYYFPFE